MALQFQKLRHVAAVWSLALGSGLVSHGQTVTSTSVNRDTATTAAQSDSPGIRPDHLWTADYLQLVVDDTGAILTAPVRWDEDQWLAAGVAVTSVGVTAAFDSTIRNHVQANRTPGEDRFMERWQNLNTFYLLAGFEAWGELGGDVRAKNVAMDGLAASIIASGLITPTLKYVVGRERPTTTPATLRFKPFSGNYSFPSGHATQAFAVATVIAEKYPTWWVEGLVYGSAALIGYARIEQNAHFASDVVAGSLIGWSVARAIVHRHDGTPDPKKLSWTPYANRNGVGLVFTKSY
jgi:membrane-associated phospholipid phosphatase